MRILKYKNSKWIEVCTIFNLEWERNENILIKVKNEKYEAR